MPTSCPDSGLKPEEPVKYVSMSVLVNVDNFVRAETDRMFFDIQRDAGGVNVLQHKRMPAPIDE
ncbi:hypothetical protein PSU4_61290 [Pseudonocardia sulfidoxydans NBRC 16205]|uniref:Uncharacterized protein n=1 Tax=Pseudonocardia sulfidoxydans NBRC 16205 TaxID=1223511 RepID=A0A511DQR0_9PSEU|nr:hypothetical protein PSU4_61290 [Pseudonocardia sulfidoxydans NBRC 16205]